MPYPHERATVMPATLLRASAHVHTLRTHFVVPHTPALPIPAMQIRRSDLPASTWVPDRVIALDGSAVEVALDDRHPSGRIAYLTVALVTTDEARLRQLDQHRPSDPQSYRAATTVHRLQTVLPFRWVHCPPLTTYETFRRTLTETLAAHYAHPTSDESALDTLLALARHRVRPVALALDYPTDMLGIHQRMTPWGGQWRVITEALRVCEVLWLMHHMRWWERRGDLAQWQRTMVVVDGPLAIFGTAGWLSRAMRRELARLMRHPAWTLGLMGIEKTGMLVEYAQHLDESQSFAPQTAILLTHADLRRVRGQLRDDRQPYGHQHYFGRKLIYKTATSQLVVVNIPALTVAERDERTAYPWQYPHLAAVLDYLDATTTTIYDNGVSSLVQAHRASALAPAVIQLVR